MINTYSIVADVPNWGTPSVVEAVPPSKGHYEPSTYLTLIEIVKLQWVGT